MNDSNNIVKELYSITKSLLYSIWITALSMISVLILERIDIFLNINNFRSNLSVTIGLIFSVIGFIIRLWAGFLFYEKGLKIISFKPQEHLIQSGPYGFSRNPLYIGIILIVLGSALIVGSVSGVIASVFVFLFWNSSLGDEEKQLERRFGNGYIEYKNKVSRWL